jgi:hypothetical protein
MRTTGRLVLMAVLLACLAAKADERWLLEDWRARYDGPWESRDVVWDMALGPDGTIHVTGQSNRGSHYDYSTVTYDPHGVELWSDTYDGPGHGEDWATAIAVDSEGNTFVTGQSAGDTTGSDFATIKYDSDGVVQWIRRYDGPDSGDDWARGVAPDGCGGAYVTGRSWDDETSFDYATIRYGSDGTERWVIRYDGPASGSDVSNTLAADDRGFVYVSGQSDGGATRGDFATIKYDSLGAEMWVARYDGPASGTDGVNWGMAVDSSGNVYVCGTSDGEGMIGVNDIATVKYDSLGNELWSARYDGPASGDDEAYDLAIGNDGSVFSVGRSWGGSHHWDYAVMKYDSDGSEEWTVRYNGPGDDWDCPHRIAVDDYCYVYVTGQSTGSGTNFDYATLVYSPSGELMDEVRYDAGSGGIDSAWGLATDEHGIIYVAGYAPLPDAPGSAADYVTIRYFVAVGVPENDTARILLRPCRPNPFAEVTRLGFDLPADGRPASLTVHDVRGRVVKRLLDSTFNHSIRSASWDGTDESGAPVSAGVYFARLRAGEETATRKIVLIR